ncbi:MAG: exodeoxyribonuclease VII large subunit [Candidatus Moranbacteria bacterium RIFCSPHIGHO2_01_FULL_54_31]|nr:MAG: exodeoxyribonuclease VII large subunit [Candidatus Moranbacteria bacterium RIFCSPHIGHO2_01_FULL_54_31]
MSLLNQLRDWRNQQAQKEGVETFRVFPNAVLDALVSALPRTKEEMLAIKGIKEAKFRKYGAALLQIIKEQAPDKNKRAGASDEKESGIIHQASGETAGGKEEDQPLSVTQFLDGLNIELSGMAARIKGEVTSVSERERWIYFSLKDENESMLSCLVSRFHYDISGVKIAEGDEIVVEGVPEIYKPNGRLSLKVSVIELFGEGALQKAYAALKKKLETEGLFAPERKRALPQYPDRIALITSKDGAAIDDFKMNLGAQGMQVDFYPTSVEGKRAVFEIMEALRFFNRHPEKYDVLIIVRGGGSLESLQAFNNEALAREVAQSSIPTLLGIGHEKDITLAALVADMMVSTPTAAAKHLRSHWDEARQLMQHFRYQLPVLFREQLADVRNTLTVDSEVLIAHLRTFRDLVGTLRQDIAERIVFAQSLVRQKLNDLDQGERHMRQGFVAMIEKIRKDILHAEDLLKQYDPKRVLTLGYSLVRSGNRILKDISETKIGDILDVQLGHGKLLAKVEKIIE